MRAYRSPEARAVMAMAARAAWATPEHRAAVQARLREVNATPAVYARRSKGQYTRQAEARANEAVAIERRYQAALAVIRRQRARG